MGITYHCTSNYCLFWGVLFPSFSEEQITPSPSLIISSAMERHDDKTFELLTICTGFPLLVLYIRSRNNNMRFSSTRDLNDQGLNIVLSAMWEIRMRFEDRCCLGSEESTDQFLALSHISCLTLGRSFWFTLLCFLICKTWKKVHPARAIMWKVLCYCSRGKDLQIFLSINLHVDFCSTFLLHNDSVEGRHEQEWQHRTFHRYCWGQVLRPRLFCGLISIKQCFSKLSRNHITVILKQYQLTETLRTIII